jgi:transcriptional regulator with XRE-family HTH domain
LINSTSFELIIIEEKKMGENIQKPQIVVDSFEELTGKISSSGRKEVEEIGQRVKTLREEKGLSLDELSKLTGYEVELLSDIEKDKVQPQLGTVIKLSKALDSAFGRLISGVSRSTSHEGKKQVYTYKSLAPEVKGRHMEAMIVQLEENPDQETSVHEGEEFIYVLDGVVFLKIGEDTFALEPGDSVYYLSTTPHLVAAKSGKATILAVLYEG